MPEIMINGSRLQSNRVALLWLLRTEMGLGVNDAKTLLDHIVTGKTISLDVTTRVRAETLTKRINYLGWNAEISDPNTPLYPE